mmetsp:Transcript_23877/g.73084  ORF Transcript_23877/g.73084 Transcript_23877/m.73084 type:complete len:391 (-) Transcript_23877:1949-3121(-)
MGRARARLEQPSRLSVAKPWQPASASPSELNEVQSRAFRFFSAIESRSPSGSAASDTHCVRLSSSSPAQPSNPSMLESALHCCSRKRLSFAKPATSLPSEVRASQLLSASSLSWAQPRRSGSALSALHWLRLSDSRAEQRPMSAGNETSALQLPRLSVCRAEQPERPPSGRLVSDVQPVRCSLLSRLQRPMPAPSDESEVQPPSSSTSRASHAPISLGTSVSDVAPRRSRRSSLLQPPMCAMDVSDEQTRRLRSRRALRRPNERGSDARALQPARSSSSRASHPPKPSPRLTSASHSSIRRCASALEWRIESGSAASSADLLRSRRDGWAPAPDVTVLIHSVSSSARLKLLSSVNHLGPRASATPTSTRPRASSPRAPHSVGVHGGGTAS